MTSVPRITNHGHPTNLLLLLLLLNQFRPPANERQVTIGEMLAHLARHTPLFRITRSHSLLTPLSSLGSSSLRPSIRLQSTLPPKLSPHDSKASGFDDIKRLFSLAIPETRPMAGALGLLCISSAVSMSVPLVIGKVLDTGNLTVEDVSIYGMSMNNFFLALTGVFIVGAFANAGRVVILRTVGEKVVARLRTRTLKASLEQDAAFLDNNRVGDLISRLSSDAAIVSRSVTGNISDGIRACLNGGVGLTMMSLVSWKLTSLMLVLAPPLGLMAFVYGKRIRNLSRDLQKAVGDLTKVAEEQLNATRTIQAYGGERLEVGKYAQSVRSVFDIGYKDATTKGVFFGTTGFIANIGLIALLGIGSSMVRNGSMTVGDLGSFMMYAVYTGSSMFGLSEFYSELMKGAGAAARIFELNDRKPLIPPTKGIKATLEDLKGPIEFRNVQFKYPTRPNTSIFNDLNFTINAGEHVCIVGPSGSGKSTVTSLLLRFYDVSSGGIFINGKPLEGFNLRHLRRLVGVVQQEPALFSGTILENITYGIKSYNELELKQALDRANVKDFISEFPDGLNTVVGARGAQVSGGQRQRIALARSLLLDPQVLILDESTSALDSNSEKRIAETLTRRCNEGKTTISIAHRVSTIKHSTRVVVIGADGRVVETGPFEDLRSLPGSALNMLLAKSEENELEPGSEIASELLEVETVLDEQEHKDMSLNR